MDNFNKLITDSRFYQAMIESEKDSLKKQVLKASTELNSPDVLDALIEVIAKANTKIQILETIVATELSEKAVLPETKSAHASVKSRTVKSQKDTVNSQESFPKNVYLTTEDLSQLRNFYEPESLPNGQAYCWTGPDRKTVIPIKIDRSNVVAGRIGFVSVVDKSVVNNFRMFCDGQEIEFKFSRDETQFYIDFSLPVGKAKIDQTMLTFVCHRVYSPHELNNGHDIRVLGLAVNLVNLEQVK